MRFSTAFSVLICGSVALAAAVTPDVARRSTADVVGVIGTLDGTLSPIFTKLDACKDSNCTVTCVGSIVSALDSATGSTVGLTGNVTTDYSNDVAKIVIDVTQELESHKSSCATCDVSSYANVDSSCSKWLGQVETSIPTTLVSVKPLVASVVNQFSDVGFTKVAKLFA